MAYIKKTLKYLFVSLIVLCILFLHIQIIRLSQKGSYEEKLNREEIKIIIDKRLQGSLKYDKGSGCEMPKMDPFDKAIMKFQSQRPPIVCDGFDWVRCNITNCTVRAEILKQFPKVECDYQDVIHVKDNVFTLGPIKKIKNGDIYQLLESDYAKVTCSNTSDQESKKSTWESFVHGLRRNVNLTKPVVNNNKTNNKSEPFNVLIMAFDSLAKNAFVRLMPKSYRTLSEMGAVILNGYNIVGEGTPAAMFPILTGKNELELPDRRKGFTSKTLDDLPFIFYKLKDHGYRTAYFEDILYKFGGTFQYRFTGFEKQPTDHYMRSYFFAVNNKRWKDKRKYCIGDTPTFQLLLNASEQLFRVEGKKFLLTFISDITHDDIFLVTSADEGLTRFLKNFKAAGHLEDTMLIVMGDHGTRFGNIRHTFLGKLEERHPLMAIMLPERLKRERPIAESTIKENINVLSTPHDLHATLLDVLDMRQYWNPMKIPGSDLKRGLTMLDPIPKTRSCSEAGIESHWCTCLKLSNITSEDNVYHKTAEAFINYINNLTSFIADCVPRKLKVIESVQHYSVTKELLKYKGQKGSEGYLSLLTGNTTPVKETYLIKVGVEPGFALYEATVEYLTTEKKFVINVGSISRINAYGDEPFCVRDTYPHLNMFCYCKRKS